jgi:hypothetical protein
MSKHPSDISREPLDAVQQQHMHNLERIYTAASVSSKLNWSQFQHELTQQNVPQMQRRSFWQRTWHAPRHLSWQLSAALILLLVVLVVAGGVGFALTRDAVVSDMLTAQQVTQQLIDQHQFTRIDQSKTINGYTFTIDQAYADSNRVIIGTYITMPHGIKDPKYFNDPFVIDKENTIVLKTQHNMILPSLSDSSALDTSNPSAGKVGDLFTFDASPLQGNLNQLPLTFEFGAGPQCQYMPKTACAHPLKFTFSLPFHTGKVVTLNQAVTENGKTYTLQKVVIAPSETRFYISGWKISDFGQQPDFDHHPLAPSFTSYMYRTQLQANGNTWHVCDITLFSCPIMPSGVNAPPGSSITGGGGMFSGTYSADKPIAISVFQPISMTHGSLKLTITRMYTADKLMPDGSYSSGGLQTDQSLSPWVFTVQY